MQQYLDLLQNILDKGREKESGRANMPNTFGVSRGTILMENVEENFPLLTTKKMYLKGIIHELLWFLRGETNIKYLVDKNVNIWNKDAYRWYLKYCEDNKIEVYFDTIERFVMFIEAIKGTWYDSMNTMHYDLHHVDQIDGILSNHLSQLSAVDYIVGDLGKVYGHQWRNQNGVDQILDIIMELKTNPYGRYKILDSWNKRDFPEMALPPCHLLYQFIVRPMTVQERCEIYFKKQGYYPYGDDENKEAQLNCSLVNIPRYYLDLNMYQRSCDTLLGVPFNIASMSILLMIMAKVSNMVAGDAFWIGGDTHIYIDHIPMVKEQLTREPYPLSKLIIKKELNILYDILTLKIDDFELLGYESHPAIKAELFTGLKK
jgi:thymidylate synthase